MKNDQLKINKFLELLPDKAMDKIFYSLSCSNMIHDENAHLIDDYLNYVAKFNIIFEKKELNTGHLEFHESLALLHSFINLNFFHENPMDVIFVLRDSRFREDHPEEYEECKKELKILTDKAKHQYDLFRRSIENYILSNNPDEPVLINNIKNKKITLPNLPITDWVKVSVKFIDERNALLSNSKETKPITPESFGCIDERTGKSNLAWNFLVKVARYKGVTPFIGKEERETEKKQKQKITDILRKIFQNDTDPFESVKGGVYKAKFLINFISNNDITNNKYDDTQEIYDEMTKD